MKTLFILALFFCLILFTMLVPNKEGFNPKCDVTNAISKKAKAKACQYTTIEKTTKDSKYAATKLTELDKLLDKAINTNQKNTKDIDSLIRNAKAMENAVDSDAEEEDADPDPCDKYPEAC